jgi:hypothetical protein
MGWNGIIYDLYTHKNKIYTAVDANEYKNITPLLLYFYFYLALK